jgi:hypothetical protein
MPGQTLRQDHRHTHTFDSITYTLLFTVLLRQPAHTHVTQQNIPRQKIHERSLKAPAATLYQYQMAAKMQAMYNAEEPA